MPLKILCNVLRSHKAIVKNTGYLSVIEIVRMIMPFIALPYIIRTVGAGNYGTVIFAQTIISYFSIFINWGLDISAVKDVSVNRDNPSELNKIVCSVLGVKAILFLLAFVVLLCCLACIPFMREYKLLFIFAFLTCISELLFPVWFYQGIEKMKYLTIIRCTSILFYTLSVFIFIRQPEHYVRIALLQSLGNLLAGGLSLYLLLGVNNIRLAIPQYKLLKETFITSFPFFVSRLSVVLNSTMAKTVSGIFFTMEAVAAFDLAQKIALAAHIPMSMMIQAVYPHIAKTKNLLFVRKFLKIDIVLSLCIAVMVALIAPLIILFFAASQLPESILLLQILCCWLFFSGIDTYLGAPVLVSFGYPRPFNISVVLSSITLFILYLILYLLGLFSIYNFAWSLVISEIVLLVYRLYYCCKFKIIV